MAERFRKFANRVSAMAGSPWVFLAAVALVIGWAVSGPFFGFSETWQLLINTCTTIVTFLMVFLIQNTQNRDSKAIHLKLDELLRALEAARNGLVGAQRLPDEQLRRARDQFAQVRERADGIADLGEAARPEG